jgi:hypothetical protein
MIHHRREIEPSVSVSRTVIDLVSDITGQSPLGLSPLEWTIDTAAIDELFSASRSRASNGLTVSFNYEGHRITVYEDRSVETEPLFEV